MPGTLHALASNLPVYQGIIHANCLGIIHASSAMQLSCHYVSGAVWSWHPTKGGWAAARPRALGTYDTRNNYPIPSQYMLRSTFVELAIYTPHSYLKVVSLCDKLNHMHCGAGERQFPYSAMGHEAPKAECTT